MATILEVTKDKVQTYLQQIYGPNYDSTVVELDDSFIVRRGSAAVHVTITPLGSGDCIIRSMAYVVQGARLTPDLLLGLMRQNAKTWFGAFGIMFDNTIVYTHTIAGVNLNANELRKSVATVAFMADDSDDKIRRIAGGKRAVDANAAIMKDARPAPPKKEKPAPKKVVTKPAPKKVVTKPAPKKVVTKPAPKKVVTKPAPKKVVKKVAPKKVVTKPAPKKVVKKVAPKKPVKKTRR
jgi:hypothetical protein